MVQVLGMFYGDVEFLTKQPSRNSLICLYSHNTAIGDARLSDGFLDLAIFCSNGDSALTHFNLTFFYFQDPAENVYGFEETLRPDWISNQVLV